MNMNSNINDIIDNLKLFDKNLDASTPEIAKALGIVAQDIARINVQTFDYEPQVAIDIKNGIDLDYETNANETIVIVEATDSRSKYQEYGTGTVGSKNSHPESRNANWIYNIPTRYKKTSTVTGDVGWFHIFDGVGKKFVTGQPAGAFMFKAYNQVIKLSNKYTQEYVEEIFNNGKGKQVDK